MKFYFFKNFEKKFKLNNIFFDLEEKIVPMNFSLNYNIIFNNFNKNNLNKYFYYFLENELKFFKKVFKKQFLPVSVIRNEGRRLTERFLKIIMQDGKSFKYFLILSKIMVLHKNYFLKFNNILNNEYNLYKVYYNLSKKNFAFFSFEYILSFLNTYVDSIFDIKVIKPTKNTRKRSKRNYKFELKYIQANKRYKFILNGLIESSKYFYKNKFFTKIYFSIIDNLFGGKNSLLYRKKLLIYKYAIRMHKSKKFKNLI